MKKIGEYELNKVMCFNSYKAIKSIPDKSIDLIITDPPYQIEHTTGGGMLKEKRIIDMFGGLVNNNLQIGIEEDILIEFLRVLKKPNIYIWCNKTLIPKLIKFFVIDNKCGFDIICWHKTNAMPLCGSKYLTDTEYCLYFHSGIKLNTTYDTAKTHYELPINTSDKNLFEHLTIKPLNIIKNFIINSSNASDIIADFFCGSGTTAVACQELGRNFIGSEISEKWCKVANDRLNKIDSNGQQCMFLR